MNIKIIFAAALTLTSFGAEALAHAASEHREITGPFATPLDCQGDNGRLDWQKLGYKGDPMRQKIGCWK